MSNGTLTDNGDGTFSLTTGAGGGGGDITDVGDCATGACFGGASGTTLTSSATDLTIANSVISSATNPYFRLTPASGRAVELWARNGQVGLGDVTNGGQLFLIGAGGQVYFPTLTSCTNGIVSNSAGLLSCGAGSATAWDAIGDPSGNGDVAMGNTAQSLTWSTATGVGTSPFTLTDTLNNTGTGYLLDVKTATGSALKPFRIQSLGADAVLVDNFAASVPGSVWFKNYVSVGDTTPATSAPSTALNVKKTFSTAAGHTAISGNIVTSNSSDPFAATVGVSGTVQMDASVDHSASSPQVGVLGQVLQDSNFTYASVRGVQGTIVDFNQGVLTQADAGYFSMTQGSAGSTWTNAAGVHITSAVLTTGAITTLEGLLIDDQTVGGTNYAIKTGLGRVSFGDNVGIGTTAPAQLLDIYSANPVARLTVNGGARSFEWWANVAGQTGFSDLTNGVQLLKWGAGNQFDLRASGVTYRWPGADGTSGQVLSTNGAGLLSWATASGGSGDITDVGDCATGAAFGGACGTSLTPSGGTLTIVGSETLQAATPTLKLDASSGTDYELTSGGSQVYLSDTTNGRILLNGNASSEIVLPQGILDLQSTVPVIRWTDTTSDSTKYETYADGSQWYLQDRTNGTILLNWGAANQLSFRAGSTNFRLAADGTNGQVLQTNGSGILSWTSVAAGTGDISDVGDCTTGAAFGGACGTTLTPSAGTLTLAGSVNISAGTPSLTLTDTTASGDDFEFAVKNSLLTLANSTDSVFYLRFNADNTIGVLQNLNLASGVLIHGLPAREFYFPASALEPLEPVSDAIPPLTKTAGTNIDEFSASFDSAAVEGREVQFVVPARVESGSTITFTWYWWSASATTNAVHWRVQYMQTGATNETWDPALATADVVCTVPGTLKQINVCTQNVTLATTGWAASDRIKLIIYRVGNIADDNMAGDAELSGFQVTVPLA